MHRPRQAPVGVADTGRRCAAREPPGNEGQLIHEVARDRRSALWGSGGVGPSVAEAETTMIDAEHSTVALDLEPTGIAQGSDHPLTVQSPGEDAGAVTKEGGLLECIIIGEQTHPFGEWCE